MRGRPARCAVIFGGWRRGLGDALQATVSVGIFA